MSNIFRIHQSYSTDMRKQIELRHLRYFVAVAEELSFTRAAHRLGMAQPPLSQQLQALERVVGHVLFHRRPRVALTAAGRAFLPGARQTLLALEHSIQDARHVGGGIGVGIVRVGLASSVPLSPVGRVLGEFRRQSEGIDLRLQELHSAELMDGLRRGMLDAAILREPAADAAFLTCEILREALVAALPNRHRLARLKVVPAAALANERFVLFPRAMAPALYDQIITVCREAGFSPQVEQEVSEWHTILALVATGFGVSLMPATVAALRVRGAATRPLRPSVARAAIFLCAPREPSTPAAEAFVRFVLSRRSTARA